MTTCTTLQGVVVAEQERVVQVVVGPSGTILDCVAGRRKYHLLEALMAEVTEATSVMLNYVGEPQ